MKFVDTPPEKEFLPIFDPKSGLITNIALRTRAHAEWLSHGHINVWIPGQKPGTVFVQIKAKSHGKRDATIGGHIDCPPDTLWELHGRHISELAPRTAVKEWREETGLIYTEADIIPIGDFTEVYDQPNPEWKLYNNGAVFAYVLNRRMALDDILRNTERESGLDFEPVDIEKLLVLSKDDNEKYLRKLLGEPYKKILLELREKMKQI